MNVELCFDFRLSLKTAAAKAKAQLHKAKSRQGSYNHHQCLPDVQYEIAVTPAVVQHLQALRSICNAKCSSSHELLQSPVCQTSSMMTICSIIMYGLVDKKKRACSFKCCPGIHPNLAFLSMLIREKHQRTLRYQLTVFVSRVYKMRCGQLICHHLLTFFFQSLQTLQLWSEI